MKLVRLRQTSMKYDIINNNNTGWEARAVHGLFGSAVQLLWSYHSLWPAGKAENIINSIITSMHTCLGVVVHSLLLILPDCLAKLEAPCQYETAESNTLALQE